MIAQGWIESSYVLAAILFILGIRQLRSATTATQGNLLSAAGMLLAVVVTLLDRHIVTYPGLALGAGIGSVIGAIAAQRVEMTAMPEMVALFNGFGGLASVLVGWAEFDKIARLGWEAYVADTGSIPTFVSTVVILAILIGAVTFTGSLVAYGKLSGLLKGSPLVFSGQKVLNGFILAAIAGGGILFVVSPLTAYTYPIFLAIVVASLILGVLGVIPIGGGDMPVVISLLNSLSGLAASAAGFAIGNTVLVVAGCLVGASGVILTVIMCKAMNRSLTNVLFGSFGAAGKAGDSGVQGEMKAGSIEDAYYVLEAARNVVVIPGYGMAVAQAQHAVKELMAILENNGAEVRFVIHPVAGRMPGHMNVLLAEADVPYEQLIEMDDANPSMDMVDVAIVIGANDVVNPSAETSPSSPIYGMPIIQAHRARSIFALKRGKGSGFSGIENPLFFDEKTKMLYGDAKSTLGALVAEFKSSAN